MFDHLAEGRFMLGVSAGALPADAELLGTSTRTAPRIFHEAVDAILALWTTDAPVQFRSPGQPLQDFQRQDGPAPSSGSARSPSRYQKPYPEIVGTVVAPNSSSATFFGEKGIHPLSANFLLPQWVKIALGRLRGGRALGRRKAVTPDDWRIARTIFVADDDKIAARYAVEDANSPYRFYYFNLLRKFRVAKRLARLQARAGAAGS